MSNITYQSAKAILLALTLLVSACVSTTKSSQQTSTESSLVPMANQMKSSVRPLEATPLAFEIVRSDNAKKQKSLAFDKSYYRFESCVDQYDSHLAWLMIIGNATEAFGKILEYCRTEINDMEVTATQMVIAEKPELAQYAREGSADTIVEFLGLVEKRLQETYQSIAQLPGSTKQEKLDLLVEQSLINYNNCLTKNVIEKYLLKDTTEAVTKLVIQSCEDLLASVVWMKYYQESYKLFMTNRLVYDYAKAENYGNNARRIFAERVFDQIQQDRLKYLEQIEKQNRNKQINSTSKEVSI